MNVKMLKLGSDYCAMSKFNSVNLTQFNLIQKLYCLVRDICQGLQNEPTINHLNSHVEHTIVYFAYTESNFIAA